MGNSRSLKPLLPHGVCGAVISSHPLAIWPKTWQRSTSKVGRKTRGETYIYIYNFYNVRPRRLLNSFTPAKPQSNTTFLVHLANIFWRPGVVNYNGKQNQHRPMTEFIDINKINLQEFIGCCWFCFQDVLGYQTGPPKSFPQILSCWNPVQFFRLPGRCRSFWHTSWAKPAGVFKVIWYIYMYYLIFYYIYIHSRIGPRPWHDTNRSCTFWSM